MKCFWCEKRGEWADAFEVVNYNSQELELTLDSIDDEPRLEIKLQVTPLVTDYNLCLTCLKRIVNAWLRRVVKESR